MGYSQAEAAERVGLTEKALERRTRACIESAAL
jgi:DNA-binding XRE family transcriptional regulator